MMEDLVLAWELFRDAWLSGVLIGVLLSLVGVIVVARGQIFLGAAIAQASTLGIAVALSLGAWLGLAADSHEGFGAFPSVLAVVFSVLAAVATSRLPGGRRESREAVTGWVFLFSASLSVLLVSFSPHGLEEVHKLLFSSVIAATTIDVVLFLGLAAVTGVAIATLHRRLLLLVVDPVMASAVGVRVGVWDPAISIWLGLCVGLSLETSGLLYTFGCLVLPPLVAKNIVREVWPMFLVAPAVAVAASVVGFLVAHLIDVPHAQVAVALQSAALLGAWCVRWLKGMLAGVTPPTSPPRTSAAP